MKIPSRHSILQTAKVYLLAQTDGLSLAASRIGQTSCSALLDLRNRGHLSLLNYCVNN